MTSVSKTMFYKITDGKTCSDIIHPMDTNCLNTWINICKGAMTGSLKFFAIIYAMQWLVKKRRCTKKYLREQMIFFTRSYIYGVGMGTTLVVTLCLSRRILGKFYYYTAIALPGFFAGLPIFLENSSMKKLNTILFFNMVLETAVRILRRDGVLIKSTTVDTAFFMLANAVFMYLTSANQLALKATLIWFFDPRQPNTNTNQVFNRCCEKRQCRKHVLQDSLKYFAFGYGFQAMKSFLPRALTLLRKPRQLVPALFNKKCFLFGSFIGSYVLIYKLVCQELFELRGRNEHSHHLLAGFLAGISYIFKPNISIALMPATLILQICWLNIRAMYRLPNWPFTELLFALCSAVLFHARILIPECCPVYIQNMTNVATNGAGDRVINNFVEVVKRSVQTQQWK